MNGHWKRGEWKWKSPADQTSVPTPLDALIAAYAFVHGKGLNGYVDRVMDRAERSML